MSCESFRMIGRVAVKDHPDDGGFGGVKLTAKLNSYVCFSMAWRMSKKYYLLFYFMVTRLGKRKVPQLDQPITEGKLERGRLSRVNKTHSKRQRRGQHGSSSWLLINTTLLYVHHFYQKLSTDTHDK